MKTLSYEDFRVQFMSAGDGDVSVRAGFAAASATERLRLPFEPGGASKLVGRLKSDRSDLHEADAHIGESLFESLFTGEVGHLFHQALGRVESSPHSGLRIRLEADLNDPAVARVFALPWELMRNRVRRQNLSLTRNIQITRFLDVNRPLGQNRVRTPLGVLVAYANPSGTIDIDDVIVAEERSLLVDSLRDVADLRIRVVDGASLSDIREALDSDTYDVLHYLGHGSFMKGAGQGFLNLEEVGSSDNLDRIDGAAFASILEGYPSLRLVVLNACKSAQTGLRDGQDPFRGVAPALVMAGVPTVVAMQFIISVRAAVEFSKGFYHTLLRTDSLEHAAADGRRRIFESGRDDIEWATPVVFTRLPGQNLFGLHENRAAEEPSPRATRTGESGSGKGHTDDVVDAIVAGVTHAAPRKAWGALKKILLSRYAETRLGPDIESLEKDPESAVRRKVVQRRVESIVDASDVGIRQAVLGVLPDRSESGKSTGTPDIRQNVSGDKNIVIGKGGVRAGDINLS